MTKIWILLAIIVSLVPHGSAHANGASSSHEVRRSEATGESPLSRDLRSKLENNARLSDSEIATLNELVLQRIYSDLSLPETQVKAEVRARFDASGEFERAQEELAILRESLHKLKALLPKLSDETLTDVGAFRTAQETLPTLDNNDSPLLVAVLSTPPEDRSDVLETYSEDLEQTEVTEDVIFMLQARHLTDQYLRENICESLETLGTPTITHRKDGTELGSNAQCFVSANAYVERVLRDSLGSDAELYLRAAPYVVVWIRPYWEQIPLRVEMPPEID